MPYIAAGPGGRVDHHVTGRLEDTLHAVEALQAKIGEVRAEAHGKDVAPLPESEFLSVIDGYCVLAG